VSAFADRTVVVTGAGGELGQAVAAAVVGQGGRVLAPVRGSDAPDLGERVHVSTGIDLADPAAVASLYAGIPDLWASIHCAGGFAMGLEPFEAMMAINATTAFLCCRGAVEAIRRRGGGGRIVNVASQQALDPRRGAGMAAYAMSKAAVAALTIALAEELAAEGIWVNAVAPSTLDTAANRAAMPKADFARWPKVGEVAEVIAFLASPANLSARGGIVPVYGKS
jgi:NAD(P)-dependent dehydrogenase (short-subunit alcohol dehydrogenase family)